MATPIPKNRLARTTAEVARATGGEVLRDLGARTHTGITSDSRQVTAGSMFVALRGEVFDGHGFLDSAARAGATLVVVDRAHAGDARGLPNVDVVAVDDTLEAWGAIAREHLASWRAAQPEGRVVAITGSAGKTTTKTILAALLAEAGDTHATAGNLNNRIGLPAMLFALEPHHRFVVVEMGMNLPGEIAALGAIAPPDVAVITNIGLAHAERLGGTRADVGREKGALFEALRETGCAIVNADDDEVERQSARSHGAKALRFGRSHHADYRLIERSASSAEGSSLILSRPRATAPISVPLPLPGEAAAIDFMAALAAAEAAADRTLTNEELTRALTHMAPAEGRAQIRRILSGPTVVDDTYNANPTSMAASIALAAELARAENHRLIVVLGEMRELGPASAEAHAALAEHLIRAGTQLAIGCGGFIDLTLARAAQAGIQVLPATSTEEAAQLAASHAKWGDVVLVKGSRGVRTERVVEALIAAFASGKTAP